MSLNRFSADLILCLLWYFEVIFDSCQEVPFRRWADLEWLHVHLDAPVGGWLGLGELWAWSHLGAFEWYTCYLLFFQDLYLWVMLGSIAALLLQVEMQIGLRNAVSLIATNLDFDISIWHFDQLGDPLSRLVRNDALCRHSAKLLLLLRWLLSPRVGEEAGEAVDFTRMLGNATWGSSH